MKPPPLPAHSAARARLQSVPSQDLLQTIAELPKLPWSGHIWSRPVWIPAAIENGLSERVEPRIDAKDYACGHGDAAKLELLRIVDDQEKWTFNR